MSDEIDRKLDALLARARPRTPRDFAAGVMARIDERRRRNRFAIAGALALAACVTVALFAGRRRAAPPPTAMSAFTLVALDGRADPPLAPGARVPETASFAVADGGMVLRNDDGASIAVEGAGSLALGRDGARLARGKVFLVGGELRTALARVVAADRTSKVEVRLDGRDDMKRTAMAGGAAVALLVVSVASGNARVVPSTGGAPIALAAGDRALVPEAAPPLTVRKAPTELAQDTTPVRPAAKPSADVPGGGSDDDDAPPAGSLDKDTLQSAVRATTGDILGCYEKALADNPKLGGRVVLDFTLVPRGGHAVVDQADVTPDESDLQAPLVEMCILDAIRRIDIPASIDAPVHVTYPFVFTPDDSDDHSDGN